MEVRTKPRVLPPPLETGRGTQSAVQSNDRPLMLRSFGDSPQLYIQSGLHTRHAAALRSLLSLAIEVPPTIGRSYSSDRTDILICSVTVIFQYLFYFSLF